jgi:hypothetical protein
VLIAPVVVLGMLTVPASCALAAGPHSMFMSPRVADTESTEPDPAIPSHLAPSFESSPFHDHAAHERQQESPNTAPFSETDADNDSGPRLRDLPEPWEMAAVATASMSALPTIAVPREPAPVSVSDALPPGRADRPSPRPPRS